MSEGTQKGMEHLLKELENPTNSPEEMWRISQAVKELSEAALNEEKSKAETEALEIEREKATADRLSTEKIERKNRVWRAILEGLGIAVSTTAYLVCFKAGLEFEEEGNISSTFLKNLIRDNRISKK